MDQKIQSRRQLCHVTVLQDYPCVKLRKYQLATERVLIFLRSQDFHDTGLEMDLSGPTSFPNDLLHVVSPAFDDLFAPGTFYRATGVILCKLSEA